MDASTQMENIIRGSSANGKSLFSSSGLADSLDYEEIDMKKLRVRRKMAEYSSVLELPPHLAAKIHKGQKRIGNKKPNSNGIQAGKEDDTLTRKLIQDAVSKDSETNALIHYTGSSSSGRVHASGQSTMALSHNGNLNRVRMQEKPEWHAPWKLMRVISGHLGWVRSVCVEPNNQWFATGSADRTIKIWDLASGTLKLSLTGHIMAVRGLAVSYRHTYLFSGGEDKMVKCWDLEQNKVIRHYHGHLSGVYALDLHPTLDLLVTAGRDAVARVWDIRTRQPVHVLTGHKGTVSGVKCQATDPQIITTSMDSTVRLWDLAAGKTQTVLTHHKKSVRALALHPEEFTFSTASPDNIKEWKCPEGSFMHNFSPPQNSIINTLSVNSDGVMFAGGDNGSMGFYDWKTGHKFQQMDSIAVPGSLEAENGIFASTFDKTGLRLITCEADKSIKFWREDPDAMPETHPGIEWKPRLGVENY